MADLLGTINFGIKGVFRLGQTARVLAGSGLQWVLGDRPPAPALMRKTFEQLGATYIKLGQFIASAPSIFAPDYVEEFQHCLDRTSPVSFAIMQTVLREDLKRPLGEIYSRIDPEPLACASIAQVHAATLVTGEDVVIKIQKPGVQDVLLTDLNFLYVAARVLEFLAPGLSRTSLSIIVSDIQKTMMEECDFIKEADNIKKFDQFLHETDNHECVVPKVYDHATAPRVLTMQRFHGVPLTDLQSIRRYSKNPELTLITAMNTWFASLMECEFFHADVHAGNLMVLEDGRIGFIDFGIVGRIAPETWVAMTALMESMALGDFRTMAESMVKVGITDHEVDIDALAKELESLNLKVGRLDPEQMLQGQVNEDEINRILLDMVDLGERHGVRFPREFALLIKQFLYFDRYARILAPEMNIMADERLKRMLE